MPTCRHSHPGRRKIGRKRFPNKAIKVKERAYEQARQLEDEVSNEPIPAVGVVLDLGVDKVSELIRSVTGSNEDAFQDTWLAIMEDHIGNEEDITRIAKEIHHKYAKDEIAQECQEISLSEPIGQNRDEGDFTYENLIKTEPLELHPPQKFHQPVSPKSVGVDRETLNILKQKFPQLSYRDAIRQMVGLSPVVKKQYTWQPWEDEIIRRVYAWGGTIAARLELPHRSIIAIRMRGRTLGLRFDKFNPQTEWLTTSQVATILGEGNHRVYDLVRASKLQHVPSKQGGISFYFKKKHIIDFLETQVWEYHVESINQEYQQYIPFSRKQWMTVHEIAKTLGCHTSTVYYYKKLKLVRTQLIHPYQVLVRLRDVQTAQKRRQMHLREKRWERVCKVCGSRNFVKFGTRPKTGEQRYRCRECHHVFSIDGALPGMVYSKDIYYKAIALRQDGLTLSQIEKHLQENYQKEISTGLLSKWLRHIPVPKEMRHGSWRRTPAELQERLMVQCKLGSIYHAEDLMAILGYSRQTKVEDTQLFRGGTIIRRNGGYVVNPDLVSGAAVIE